MSWRHSNKPSISGTQHPKSIPTSNTVCSLGYVASQPQSTSSSRLSRHSEHSLDPKGNSSHGPPAFGLSGQNTQPKVTYRHDWNLAVKCNGISKTNNTSTKVSWFKEGNDVYRVHERVKHEVTVTHQRTKGVSASSSHGSLTSASNADSSGSLTTHYQQTHKQGAYRLNIKGMRNKKK